jgi:hypothetical protein
MDLSRPIEGSSERDPSNRPLVARLLDAGLLLLGRGVAGCRCRMSLSAGARSSQATAAWLPLAI